MSLRGADGVTGEQITGGSQRTPHCVIARRGALRWKIFNGTKQSCSSLAIMQGDYFSGHFLLHAIFYFSQ